LALIGRHDVASGAPAAREFFAPNRVRGKC